MFRTNYLQTHDSASGIALPAPPLTWGDWLRSGGRLLAREIRRGAAVLDRWHQRGRSRRHLMALDGRMLRDIGISRAEADAEFRKPFWRP